MAPAYKEHPDLNNPDHLDQLSRQLSRSSDQRVLPLGRVVSISSAHNVATPGLEQKHNILGDSVPENSVAASTSPTVLQSQPSFQGGSKLNNTTSRQSNRSKRSGLSRKQSRFEAIEGEESDEEVNDAEDDAEDEDDLEMENLLQQIFGNAGDEESSQVKQNIGLIFEDMTVHGAGLGATFFNTPSILAQPFLHPLQTFRKMRNKSKTPTRILVDHFTGVVRPGELVLVLGQPGSGTTTTLRALAGYDEGFEKVEGVVRYGDVSMEEMKKKYRGEVAFNDEKDQHLATLTVEQTLRFAAKCRTPRAGQRPSGDASTRDGFVKVFLNVLGSVFGLSHVMGTKVGNDLIRGISGGEKKRVSISEVLACRALVTMWDNSTRGLDSSSAIGYVRSLRALTNLTKGSTLVSLYQASEALYTQFDKVMLIDKGQMLYFGPADQGVKYFEDMGFEHNPRQTSADYLASCTDPNARIVKDSHKDTAPKTTAQMVEAWKKSEHRQASLQDLEDYKKSIEKQPRRDDIEAVTEKEKTGKKGRAGGNYSIPLWRQVYYLTIRQYQLIWGDKTALIAKNGGAIAQALIVGSCFYDQANNTGSAFSWGGVLFFALLFQALQGLSELSAAFEARAIIMRHKAFAFYSPAAYPLAQMLADAPIIFVQNALFGIILYFMTGLDVDASKFFIFYLIIYFTCLCTFALFRALACTLSSLDGATAFGGILLNALIVYSGYVIPWSNMRYYFRWIPYINPVYYGYEALSANQFTGLELPCAQYVPSGPTYTNTQYGVCAIAGAQAGRTTVQGGNYIDAQFKYTRRHLWRNFAALIGFFILFLLISVFGLTVLAKPTAATGSIVEYKRGHAPARLTKAMEDGDAEVDEERALEGEESATRSSSETANDEEIVGNASVFTFNDVCYTVKVKGGSRDLLQNVQGWVRPGKLTALVGASGAGKTTLLSALSQRLPTATGDFQIDGKPLPPAFVRLLGFVEQSDIHEPFSTVREALQFSAQLRQPRSVSKADKLAYVEEILKLLEMEDIAEARIGSGLSIELQKRVTIGVELAAKPALMLFLDEPTSGLDGQGAWNLVRLLRKLAAHGMSILATIHQPSSELFQQFDEVLLLGKGGVTIYFGEIGKDAKTLTGYFGSNGSRKIHDGENPAEYMVARAAQTDKGWSEKWNKSQQCKDVTNKIQELRNERKDVQVSQEIDTTSTYAAPWSTQFKLVTIRTFTAVWRDTNYLTGKFMLHISIALFLGFSFFRLGDAVADTQSRLFSIFLTLTISPPLIQQLQPKFLDSRSLYESREGKSRIYSWVPLIFSSILVEIPLAMFCISAYFALWYNLVGHPLGKAAGVCFLVLQIFALFYVSLGQMLAAMAPNAFVASLLVPLTVSILFLFSGVLQPLSQMIPFYRPWLPNINPLRWILSALLSEVLHDKPVRCKPKEFLTFDPPPGETCGSYMVDFFANPRGLGYVQNEQATSGCRYCQYATGEEYLSTLEVDYTKRWQYIGYACAFVLFNWVMVFVLTWAFRMQENPFKKLKAGSKTQKTDSTTSDFKEKSRTQDAQKE